jgi:hypothetical protein
MRQWTLSFACPLLHISDPVVKAKVAGLQPIISKYLQKERSKVGGLMGSTRCGPYLRAEDVTRALVQTKEN